MEICSLVHAHTFCCLLNQQKLFTRVVEIIKGGTGNKTVDERTENCLWGDKELGFFSFSPQMQFVLQVKLLLTFYVLLKFQIN